MKGQFFIISTIIMISALFLIVQYLFDFGEIDLTTLENTREYDYNVNVYQTLYETAKNTDCERSDKDMLYAKEFLTDQLIEKSIKFEMEYVKIGCPTSLQLDIKYNLSSVNFFSNNSFTYP